MPRREDDDAEAEPAVEEAPPAEAEDKAEGELEAEAEAEAEATEPAEAGVEDDAAAAEAAGPSLAALSPQVAEGLQNLFKSGKVAASGFSQASVDELAGFEDATALTMLMNVATSDLTAVGDVNVFLGGIMRTTRTLQASMGAAVKRAAPANPDSGKRQRTAGGDAATPYGADYQAQRSAAANAATPAMFNELAPPVQAALQAIVSSGRMNLADLDNRCYAAMTELAQEHVLEIIRRMSISDLSEVKSKTGFFLGIVKRYKERIFANDPVHQNREFEALPPETKKRFAELFASGAVRPDEFEARCFTNLQPFRVDQQVHIIDRFAYATNLPNVKSKTGFFISITRRYKEEHGDSRSAPTDPHRPGRYGSGGGGPRGGYQSSAPTSYYGAQTATAYGQQQTATAAYYGSYYQQQQQQAGQPGAYGAAAASYGAAPAAAPVAASATSGVYGAYDATAAANAAAWQAQAQAGQAASGQHQYQGYPGYNGQSQSQG
mmetsp:Transcript_25140/g.78897  ORF Transcript_25140/g.78897 Transcript_25140/m.78897 type:complete len:492 (-) Transcript_25140:280-1755(-)